MKILTAIAFCLLISGVSSAEIVSIKGLQGLDETHYHRVDSDILQRGFDILVGLPAGYDPNSSTTYPTIYLLDGGVLFPLLRGYYNYLRNSEEAPEAILVGISYGSRDFATGNHRGHDYTAPSDEREHYGGAENFQIFLKDELLPFIESEYQSDGDQRVIFGQSLGGQFVLFTAQTKPNLFAGHIASNPALHRNLPLFLEMNPQSPPKHERSRLFVGSGSHDDPVFRQPALSWINHWTEMDETPWDLQAVTLDTHTHFSAPPASFRQGLKWVFAL
ncbi:MAG: alpha/beta hydrolase [Woeseiaceae bacterium]